MLRTVRDACTIHPIVHDYRMSEAIENLSDLIKEEGNGEEFFARNYVTQGMDTLFREGILRLAGKSDQAAFELAQAMGLDNYQNFAKAFRVADYAAVMASIKPNAARLKAIPEFKARDLSDRTELGPTPLGALFIAIQEFMAEKEPEVVMANLRDALIDYLQLRPVLIDLLEFIAAKARQPDVRRAAEALASRVRHQRLQ